MRKILAGTLFMALAGTLSIAATPQDRDERHDNGKHKGWDNTKIAATTATVMTTANTGLGQ